MESVKLRIKGSIVTNRFGALSDGDIIKTDEAYAKHLVDMGAAEYEGPMMYQDITQSSAQESTQAPAQESAPAAQPSEAVPQEAPEADAPEGARQIGQEDKSTRRRKAD